MASRNSNIVSVTFAPQSPAATPTFTPAAGTYNSVQSVVIACATAGATIYYTTDGSTPTTSSAVYSAPVSVGVSETLKAMATAAGYLPSAVASANYVINLPQAATPAFSPGTGTYNSVQSVTIASGTAGASIYYTTDGSTPTTGSTLYSAPVSVASSETLKAIATASGYTQSSVGSAAYVINLPQAATPTFSPAAGTYTGTQNVTILSATGGAVIHYTSDGSTPTTSSPVYSAPVAVASSETLNAIAVASGYTQSNVGSASYVINLPQAATPTFLPVAGNYASAQSVQIQSATAGATIYYTTDGSTPTTSSTVYFSAVNVAANETLKAIATAAGYTQSNVGSAVYTIGQCDPHFGNVELLLHFDGANGSMTFTDSSLNNFFVTGNSGSPATSLETSNVLYGTASANFGNGSSFPTESALGPATTGTNAPIPLSTATQLNPGTGDFTMECWINTNNFSNSLFGVIGSGGANVPAGFGTQLIGGPLVQYYWYDDSGTQHYREIGVPAGSWAHVAFVRYSGNITCYVNGVASYSDAYAGNFNLAPYLSSSYVVVGWAEQGLYQYSGLMDEFRYTVGVARYTANFPPPTTAFPNIACN
jgi:hypothetical protein